MGDSDREPWKGSSSLADVMATGASELNFLYGLGFILRQWAQMSHEALSRDSVPQAELITLNGRGSTYLGEIDEALVDNLVI